MVPTVHKVQKRRSKSELQQLTHDCPILMSLGFKPTNVSPSSPLSYQALEKLIQDRSWYNALLSSIREEREQLQTVSSK